MSERRRQRKGLHSSVAGAPAEEALGDLVRQFSDRYAFVRELIQNSLDASASRVEVEARWEEEPGRLVLSVSDDGEGMDRETIEGYLLVLFRSTKENDSTRIGKFGIGFVSLFAMEPDEVLVDTGRDQVWHRVAFDRDRQFTLMRMDEPREGTTVTLHLSRTRVQALEDARRARESATRWCRYAEADIRTSAAGFGAEDWPSTPVAEPFTLNLPLLVEEKGDGFHAVMGPARQPAVGFYNHGLTLWEHSTAMIPGVSFRVKGRHLEHTLTRDNVRREKGFDEVMRRLWRMARERLGPALMQALAEAAQDPARRQALWGLLAHDAAWEWDLDAPVVPRVGAPPCGLKAVERAVKGGGLFSLKREPARLVWSTPRDPVGQALAAQGTLVVEAERDTDPHLSWLSGWLGVEKAPAGATVALWTPAEPPPGWAPLAQAAAPLFAQVGPRGALVPAALSGAMADSVLWQTRVAPGTLAKPQEGVSGTDRVLVNLAHPLVVELLALPPALAAPLLTRAACLDLAVTPALPGVLLDAALGAVKEGA